jgi:capsid protein
MLTKLRYAVGFKTLGQVIAEQGGDLDDYLTARQSELAKLDDKNIVVDTDPSEVSGAGLIQYRPQGTVDSFGDTTTPDTDD